MLGEVEFNMDFSKEYLDDILVRLAHHSSAIEGNTITLSETVSIILHNTVSGQKPHKQYLKVHV